MDTFFNDTDKEKLKLGFIEVSTRMFTQSIKFYYTFYFHVLRVQMFEKCDSSNRQ